MRVPLAAWCLQCNQPSASTELCPRCQQAITMLPVHADAEGTAPRIFEALKGWQRRQARVQGTDGFMVVPNKALAALAAVQPDTREALIEVPGIGPKKARDYGPVLLRYFRSLHEGKPEEPLVARAPMPEGLDEAEQGLMLELREAAKPLSVMAAEHGLSLDAWLGRIAGLVEKGAVDLPHIYCSPAELAWLMPVLDAEPRTAAAELAKRFPEASPAALALLPALARYRGSEPDATRP